MRLIDADALEQIFLDESGRLRKQIINDEVSCEEANYIRSFMPTIEWARKTVHRCATVDAVEVDAIQAWLYEIAMNNTGNVSRVCEELISRLDGLRVFAKERRTEGGR